MLDVFDQAKLRFVWAFISLFNKHFSKTVRFINQSTSAMAIPEKARPMSISGYLNSSKEICLQQAKNELKHLVLMRTAIPVAEDDSNLPKIVFRRMKDASQ